MIQTNRQRQLSWYFENLYLPAHRDKMHGSLIGAVRKTVADFIRFAQCDPTIEAITDLSLDEFERFSRAHSVTAHVAAIRRERIAAIVRHAMPANPKPVNAKVIQAGEGTLRHYVRSELLKFEPDLRPATVADYNRVVNRFCEWVGGDIAIADVTPTLVDEFEETSGQALACRIRGLMRFYDPVLFRRRGGKSPRALQPSSESAFLLVNTYANGYEPTALRSRRPNTKRLYRTTLVMFDKFLGREATLDDLQDDVVSQFATWRLENGLAKSSVNKDLFNLLALWRWCHRKGLVEVWPDVQLEKPQRRQPMAWTEREMKKLYRTAANLDGTVGKLKACDFWAALLLVCWDSAERIGAVIRLQWENVDLERGWLRFDAEHRKGGRDDSTVRISAETIKALRKICAKNGAVFPWPFSFTYLWTAFAAILNAAGLPSDHKSKFHRIRKTVASHAEARGGNATAMLRHSKREVTEAYLDPRLCQQQQPIDVLFRLS